MRKSALIFACLLLSIGAPVLYADVAFGGTGSIDFELMIDHESFAGSDLEQVYKLTPQLSILSDIYEFSASGSISLESSSGSFGFSLQEFKLATNLTDFMSLKLGYFNYLPGTAEVLSNTNFFSRTDFERLLSGTVEDSIIPATIVQTGFFFQGFYLLLTASPFRPEMIVPATDSPWFSGKDIPQSIIVQAFGSEIVLDKLDYAGEEAPPYDFSQVSFSPELGGTVWGVDFSILYYNGYDNEPLLGAELTLHGLYDGNPYDIVLTPVYRRIHALGLNLATSISALRLWGDAAFTFNKSFLANRVSDVLQNTPVVKSPYIEYSLGFSYEFPFLDLIALAEFKNSHIIDASEFIIEPALSSVILAALNFSLFKHRLSTYSFIIYSIADPSVAAVFKISFNPFADLAVRLVAPFFFGQPNTELGQYSRNHFVSAEVEWGY